MTLPVYATYRIQTQPEFTLTDAAGIVPYLNRLGISHLYSSPFLQSAPGSKHGYDVVDYGQVNRELGGREALDRLVAALHQVNGARQAGGRPMGLVMDMVPNHMAIHPSNPWWWDVLMNGPSSPYAFYFDVEWDSPETRFANAVLVPVLGDQYGRVLEAGEVQVVFDGDTFTVRYFDNVYPVDPGTLSGILGGAAGRVQNEEARNQLIFLAGAYGRLPESAATDLTSARRRYRDTKVLRGMLGRLTGEDPGVAEAIRAEIAAVNQSPEKLDMFLRHQNYRLSLWKISATELGYRRFFDINTLIGLRMEDSEVYHDTHALVMDLVRRGALDGLRIDHPDGLRDPGQYLQRLRADVTQLGRPDTWIVVEKILEPGERMPAQWPVQGTTGYDFLNRVNGLFVDPHAEGMLTDFYGEFTGLSTDYPALVHEKKILAAKQVLGSDLSRLTELFLRVCERHRNYRDYSRSELRDVLAETTACLPVYRTYVEQEIREQVTGEPVRDSEGAAVSVVNPSLSGESLEYITQAVETAKTYRPEIDPRLFDFLRELLLLRSRGPLEDELVARFQQFTGPVMAKGLEDTVFYIYNRLVSLNEVGGDPGHFGLDPDHFHQACQETLANWPLSMLATSTHDTKRSEDVRARLDVISEIPGAWIDAVRRWSEMNEAQRTDAVSSGNPRQDNRWPDRNTEYLLYQTLVGAWPISADRAVEYMRKAGREAKVFTTWTTPNEAYEAAVEKFIRAVLDDSRFTADLETFVAEILKPGRINSLAQTLLKITTPGIPDFYQGTELWNLCLVDPDNRRPVDYEQRRRLLERLSDDTSPEQVLARDEEGLPKLWLICQALALRQQHPDWFGPGSAYTPLAVEWPEEVEESGSLAGEDRVLPRIDDRLQEELEAEEQREVGGLQTVDDDSAAEEPMVAVTGAAPRPSGPPALAFLRGENLLVAVPRLAVRYRASWDSARITLPPGRWRSPLTQEIFDGGPLTLAKLFERFPVGLLVKADR